MWRLPNALVHLVEQHLPVGLIQRNLERAQRGNHLEQRLAQLPKARVCVEHRRARLTVQQN